MVKKPKGKQKIEIKKIDDYGACHVAFSTRRLGLYKQASGLSTLCGAELAIVVFSCAGRAFTFGQPEVNAIASRFLGSNSNSTTIENPQPSQNPIDLHRENNVLNLNNCCMELSELVEAQKKKQETLKNRLRTLTGSGRDTLISLDEGLQNLGPDDLQKLAKGLEDLALKVDARAHEALHEVTGPFGVPLAVNSLQIADPYGSKETHTSPLGWFI